MLVLMQDDVEQADRVRPKPIVSLGGTDARLWRQAGVPASVYGPRPMAWAAPTRHVEIADYLQRAPHAPALELRLPARASETT